MSTATDTGHSKDTPLSVTLMLFAAVIVLVAGVTFAVMTWGLVALILTGVVATFVMLGIIVLITAGG
ncbi:hypothetical protein [Phaeovulum vinaykumarii]|uniref:Uncharacterized protein n=1 Tax=Phaeovulum vinaykumarii TaxID=407234 RepID=A0A1N7JJ81_9RHOB|nr:hypothetical protein [Phaeovulum vinaykumarii]SIS49389.1 hypothetical protein SAMN05421795_10148 [Phaeovulum vinaykumarii]SOB89674.1 hypothetical protein SAMN05878426_10148 [Phaeovulum vinaykumarii]